MNTNYSNERLNELRGSNYQDNDYVSSGLKSDATQKFNTDLAVQYLDHTQEELSRLVANLNPHTAIWIARAIELINDIAVSHEETFALLEAQRKADNFKEHQKITDRLTIVHRNIDRHKLTLIETLSSKL